jgi:hypothetical protein
MAHDDPTVGYSKELCEKSESLRARSKIAVEDAKAALARSLTRLRLPNDKTPKTPSNSITSLARGP